MVTTVVNSHVSQIELRTVNMSGFPSDVSKSACTVYTPQASGRPGQSGQLFRPVKSVAAGKTVSDHVIVR